ncbi:pentapeptide repeat-containing protein [Spiroplasma phoeniceum]|uniref:Pentapeptide repeat-containing protein n=1 Tax=Spiroplasma phoeniceum P40 TaxID=1276259 RepID=A0A345DMB8_9MOLU|nr:pentapeptide repeat-containing protein [Spiroplasma phoeniceum]AXF95356.1 hypothetical protein SDAV_00362 [Spiroplasma phoeniceum P40]
MKTLQDLIKDLTDITVEEQKINEYLEYEALDLQGADLHWADLKGVNLQGADLHWADLKGVNLSCANLKGIKITKEQLEQLTVIEENE